jgi:hypothetical protein
LVDVGVQVHVVVVEVNVAGELVGHALAAPLGVDHHAVDVEALRGVGYYLRSADNMVRAVLVLGDRDVVVVGVLYIVVPDRGDRAAAELEELLPVVEGADVPL